MGYKVYLEASNFKTEYSDFQNEILRQIDYEFTQTLNLIIQRDIFKINFVPTTPGTEIEESA